MNPLLEPWDGPYGLPPFDRIREEHYLPAFREAIDRDRAEVQAISRDPAPPTFANTIEALDRTGDLLDRVRAVFFNLLSAESTPGLQAIAKEVAPLLAALDDDTLLDEVLYRRVDAVFQARAGLGLDPEQLRLVEETRKRFVRGGAGLDAAGKERLRAIHQELSVLGLQFGDNLLAETNEFRMFLEKPGDLAGLSPALVAAAAEAAEKAGRPGTWLFTLQAPSYLPFLQQSERRDLRQRMVEAYARRGDQGNDRDNRALLLRQARLRAEKAKLLGFATWADYVLDDRMAGTPARAQGLLDRLWKPAKAVAAREARDLGKLAARDGVKDLAPWDWSFYSEKIRKSRYGIDDGALRPYFALDNVLKGAFEVARRLYGITFEEKTGLKLYHPEVRAFEVRDGDGSFLGLFLADYHPRSGKRGGAWANRFRGQYVRDGQDVRPIVANVGNFTRPSGGAPALLSADEVETLFHELGHGLHSLLSRIRYKSLASVPRDFVELPSQLMENWVLEPEVLKLYARHWKTGEVIPAALVRRIQKARRFNQGFATAEYLAASYLDLAWHGLSAGADAPDAREFEQATLARLGLLPGILPRYRSTYFQHVFGPGGGYSAGYYSYIWCEVLDADAFAAFQEKGLFDPATARAFRTEILEKAGSADAMAMYRRFRGREPDVAPLLKRRGL